MHNPRLWAIRAAQIAKICAMVGAAGALVVTAPASAESLRSAIALAYQSNPTLLAARADLQATDERYVQARAGLGPTLGISVTSQVENAQITQNNAQGVPKTVRNHAQNNSYQLTANQPLYASGQISASISATRAAVLAGRQTLRKAEATMLSQVIGAYLDVILGRDLVEIARQNIELLEGQSAETLAKFKVREATATDRAQAEARLLAARIRLTEAKAALVDREARYLAAVGQPPGDLEPPPDLPGIPPTLIAAFDAADQASPVYLAARYTELASRARVREARAAYGFKLGLELQLSQEPVAAYLDHSKVEAASASVTLSKSLFTSGAMDSRIREAMAANNGDNLRLSESHRQVTLAVVAAWTDLVASRSLLANLREQLVLEQQAFVGSSIEQRIGLRSTIDVLNAEQEYQNTKVSLAQNYHDEYLNRVALMAAIGVLQTELIDPAVDIYSAEESLNRGVRSGALPWNLLVEQIDSIGVEPMPLDAPARDPLSVERLHSADAMPAPPRWAELSKFIADKPSPQLTKPGGMPRTER